MSQFTMGGMIGADPDQLISLGHTLSRQRGDIESRGGRQCCFGLDQLDWPGSPSL